MKISVVIPTYNSEKTIGECLLSFSKQTYPPHEIVVVDGKSTDSTTKIVKSIKEVKLIINEKSRTPGSSRNRGAETATGEVLFFCDSDCVADKKVLEYHVKAYKSRYGVSGVMGSIRNAGPRNAISNFVQKEIMASQWLRSLNPDGTVKYFHAGIYNFSIYRSEFLKRKFREEPMVSEDTELSIRISGKLKILFEPRAIVFHHHPTTLQALFEQRKWYGERFFGLTKYCRRESFKPDSLSFSALRCMDFPEDYLYKAVFQDNCLLCKGCRIRKCKIDVQRLPRQGDSDKYLCRVVCLAFASGILKQRSGIDYPWQ